MLKVTWDLIYCVNVYNNNNSKTTTDLSDSVF